MATQWTNRRIDQALRELRDASRTQPVFSAEWEQVLETRVHREVDARFGVGAWHERILTDAYGYSRITDKKMDVHTVPVSVFGMLEELRVFFTRPAFALATMVVVVAGVLAYRQSTDSTLANRPRDPQTSSAVAVAPAVPFGEGTGFAVSVFGEALAVAPSGGVVPIRTAPASAPRYGVRRSTAIPINPAAGVFTTWGTSVFSDDEALTRPWEGGKYVFSS